MQVTLNIDTAQLGDTLVDLFQSLTNEQKQELALKILGQWLEQPYQVERAAHEQEIFRKMREITDWNGKLQYANVTDEKLRHEYKYSELMKGFESSREKMVREITAQVISHHKQQITESIQTDEKLNQIMTSTFDVIRDNFPNMVRDAVIAWFAQNMSGIASMAASSFNTATNTDTMLRQLNESLRERGVI